MGRCCDEYSDVDPEGELGYASLYGFVVRIAILFWETVLMISGVLLDCIPLATLREFLRLTSARKTLPMQSCSWLRTRQRR
jgi:hypothetical protein